MLKLERPKEFVRIFGLCKSGGVGGYRIGQRRRVAGFEGDDAHRNGKIVTLVDYLKNPGEDYRNIPCGNDVALEWRVQGLDPDDPKALISVKIWQLLLAYEHDPNTFDGIESSEAQDEDASDLRDMGKEARVAAFDEMQEIRRDCAFANMPCSEEALAINREMMVSEATGEAEWWAAVTAAKAGKSTYAQKALIISGSSPITPNHEQTYIAGAINGPLPKTGNKQNTSRMFDMHNAFRKHGCTLYSPTWRVDDYREAGWKADPMRCNPTLGPLLSGTSHTSGISVLLQCNSNVLAIQGWGYDDTGSDPDWLVEQSLRIPAPKNRVGACPQRGARTDSNGDPLSPIHGVICGDTRLFSTIVSIPEAASIVKLMASGWCRL